jgi:hypothetical protein
VYGATTGHDIKSRAHLTIVEGCYVHDCQNREFDLVDDAENTTVPGSDALIAGCVIVKGQNISGNKTVIHFGQDGGYDHNGTLYVVFCTIVTPYVSPVVDLSAPSAGVNFTNAVVTVPSGTASGQVLVNARNGSAMANAAGQYMWMSSGFSTPAGGTFSHITIGAADTVPHFVDAAGGKYELADSEAGIVDAGLGYTSIALPQSLAGRQLVAFQVPLGYFARAFVEKPTLGAYEWNAASSAVIAGCAYGNPQVSRFIGAMFDLRGRRISASWAQGRMTRSSGCYLVRSSTCGNRVLMK